MEVPCAEDDARADAREQLRLRFAEPARRS
jgi:hypothetical protein